MRKWRGKPNNAALVRTLTNKQLSPIDEARHESGTGPMFDISNLTGPFGGGYHDPWVPRMAEEEYQNEEDDLYRDDVRDSPRELAGRPDQNMTSAQVQHVKSVDSRNSIILDDGTHQGRDVSTVSIRDPQRPVLQELSMARTDQRGFLSLHRYSECLSQTFIPGWNVLRSSGGLDASDCTELQDLLSSTQDSSVPDSVAGVQHEKDHHRKSNKFFQNHQGKNRLMPAYNKLSCRPNINRVSSGWSTLMKQKSTLSEHACGFDDKGIYAAWLPWELTYLTVFSFISFDVVLMIILGLMYWASEKNQGLGSSSWKYHYLWTYGPTAVLTGASTVWHRVNYRVKQLQPWKLMASGPTSAENGLLLDYVSPISLEVLYRAVSRGHLPVVFSVLVDFLFKILIILSTSFLVLQTVTISDSHFPMVARSKFSGSSYNASLVGGDAAAIVGSTTRQFNSSFPAWTQDGSAVQPFNATQTIPRSAYIHAQVDAFVAYLGACESGESSVWYPPNSTTAVANLTTAHCAVQVTIWNSVVVAESYTTVDTEKINCSGFSSSDSSERLLIYFAASSGTEFQNFTYAICKPYYSLMTAIMTLDASYTPSTTWPTYNKSSSTSSDMISGIDNTDVLDGFLAVFRSPLPSAQDFLQWQLTGSCTLDNLECLLPATRYLYENVAAQIAYTYMAEPANEWFVGTLFYQRDRVLVRPLVLGLMEATLVVLIIFTGLLVTVIPRQVISRNPGSIAGIATILASSEAVADHLSNEVVTPLSGLGTSLAKQDYQTTVTSSGAQKSFGIFPRNKVEANFQAPSDYAPNNVSTTLQWWHPTGFTRLMVVVSLIVPLIMIAVLESVLQMSQRQGGIAVITNKNVRYAWIYIPAIIMVLIGLLFSSFAFAVRLTNPYLALQRGGATAHTTLLHDPLQDPSILVLWHSITDLRFFAGLAAIASIIGPVLPIAVSGLFAGENTLELQNAPVHCASGFNSAFQGWTPQNNAANFEATMLQTQQNLSYPQWTYDTLVFPELESYLANPELNHSAISSLTLTLPALQGQLSCRNLPIDILPSDAPGWLNVSSSIPYVPYWSITGTVQDTMGVWVPEDSPDYFGQFSYPGCWAIEGGTGYSCDPTWTYGVAYFGYGNVSSANVTAIVCDYPVIQQIQTEVTFNLPDYTIDSNAPPIPDYSTATLFSNQSFVPDIGSADISGYGYVEFNYNTSSRLVTLMDVAINGRHSNSDPSTYFDPDLLATRVQYAYNVLVAQYLAQMFRIPANTTSSTTQSQPLRGTYTLPPSVRLIQSSISTRILETLLAILFLCALIVHTTVTPRARRLLPKNPCSLAAMASLLAGSKLLTRDVLPEGSEWMGKGAVSGKGRLEGMLFSMGWWDHDCDGDGNKKIGLNEGPGIAPDDARNDDPATAQQVTHGDADVNARTTADESAASDLETADNGGANGKRIQMQTQEQTQTHTNERFGIDVGVARWYELEREHESIRKHSRWNDNGRKQWLSLSGWTSVEPGAAGGEERLE